MELIYHQLETLFGFKMFCTSLLFYSNKFVMPIITAGTVLSKFILKFVIFVSYLCPNFDRVLCLFLFLIRIISVYSSFILKLFTRFFKLLMFLINLLKIFFLVIVFERFVLERYQNLTRIPRFIFTIIIYII